MSSYLRVIVRSILREDTAAQKTNMQVYADPDFSGGEEDDEGEIAGDGAQKLFGDATDDLASKMWGGSYATGAENHKKRSLGNWESDNAWDIFAPEGTPVYAIADGKVGRVKASDPSGPNAHVVYGDQISLAGANGYPSVYYTHLTARVQPGQDVRAGDLIGTILKHPTNNKMPQHVHIGIDRKMAISALVSEDGTIKGAMSRDGEVAVGEDKKLPYASVVPSEDIKFYGAVLRGIGAPESENNLRFMSAWRQAEGGSARFNPFNTTQQAEGATNYNSAKVKNYTSEEQGIAATVKTLLLSYYSKIVADMRADSSAVKTASNHDQLRTWGTGMLISTVLNGSSLRSTPIARSGGAPLAQKDQQKKGEEKKKA